MYFDFRKMTFYFHGMKVLLSRDGADEVVAGSAVQAAQNRKRGPSLLDLERLRADEEYAAEQAAVASARSS